MSIKAMKNCNIEEVADVIIRSVSYLDSIAIWLKKPLKAHEYDNIRLMSGSLNLPSHPEPMKYNPMWRVRLLIHQPSTLALVYLHDLVGDDCLINHLAYALDLEAKTQKDVLLIKNFLSIHQIKPYHGNQELSMYGATEYSSRRRIVSNNIVRYWDKDSKVFGFPCSHVENRTQGSQAVRRIGIENIIDVINFHHLPYWKKVMQLRQINLEKLGRKSLGHSRHKKPKIKEYISGHPFDMYRRVGNLYMRSIQEDDQYPLYCAQKFIDNA